LRAPAKHVNEIVNEKRGITANTALRLLRFFGTTPRFGMNMQAADCGHTSGLAFQNVGFRLSGW